MGLHATSLLSLAIVTHPRQYVVVLCYRLFCRFSWSYASALGRFKCAAADQFSQLSHVSPAAAGDRLLSA